MRTPHPDELEYAEHRIRRLRSWLDTIRMHAYESGHEAECEMAAEALQTDSSTPSVRAEDQMFSAPATPGSKSPGCADPVFPAIGASPEEDKPQPQTAISGSGDGGERPALFDERGNKMGVPFAKPQRTSEAWADVAPEVFPTVAARRRRFKEAKPECGGNCCVEGDGNPVFSARSDCPLHGWPRSDKAETVPKEAHMRVVRMCNESAGVLRRVRALVDHSSPLHTKARFVEELMAVLDSTDVGTIGEEPSRTDSPRPAGWDGEWSHGEDGAWSFLEETIKEGGRLRARDRQAIKFLLAQRTKSRPDSPRTGALDAVHSHAREESEEK